MEILITLKHAQLIKKELGLNLPHVKSSHRTEAMARGLGWKSNAALRAALMCGDAECTIDDTAFVAYLTERGFKGVPPDALMKAISTVLPVPSTVKEQKPELTSGTGIKHWSLNFSNAGWAAAGLIVALLYLLLNVQTAEQRLELEVQKSLDVASTAAERSILIFDRELATEVAKALLEYDYVTKVTIVDDHGNDFVALSSPAVARSPMIELRRLVTLDATKVYKRALKLPPTLGQDGFVHMEVDRAQALAVLPGPTWLGITLAIFAGVGAWALGSIASQIGKARLRRHLAETYRTQHA